MSLSWRDREARIEKDDGDADETVYLLAESSTSAYHTRRDCTGLSRRDGVPIDERTRGEAQADIRPPCGSCVLSPAVAEIDHRSPEQRFADLIAADRDRRQSERERRRT